VFVTFETFDEGPDLYRWDAATETIHQVMLVRAFVTN